MSTDEYHVASFIVQTFPDQMQTLSPLIDAMPGVDVHASEKGKLVVTAEGDSQSELAKISDSIRNMEHVLTVSPVFHQYESASN